MDDRQRIIDKFKEKLEPLTYVQALWLEGSGPQGYADDYSDIDLWISVEDEKFTFIYSDVDGLLNELGVVDLRYVMKTNQELGHVVYHLKNMSEFLTVDVNAQKKSREVTLSEATDKVDIIFDKSSIIKFHPERVVFDKPSKDRLLDYFKVQHPNVLKNIKRNKPLEAFHYYDAIIEEVIRYFRLQAWDAEKANYWRKHIYRDLKYETTKKLEYFTFIKVEELEAKLEELGGWIKSI
jgi:predicted nucleotidyltransferase